MRLPGPGTLSCFNYKYNFLRHPRASAVRNCHRQAKQCLMSSLLVLTVLDPCNPMDGRSSIKAFIARYSTSIFMISQPDGV